MTVRVDVAQSVFDKANERYGQDRTSSGRPSEYDFVSGPLGAAVFAFRDFDALAVRQFAEVRTYTILDPIFGPVSFVAVRRDADLVEVIDFDDDPDYWEMIRSDPE